MNFALYTCSCCLFVPNEKLSPQRRVDVRKRWFEADNFDA